MKYMVYAEAHEEENDISIQCHDEDDMNTYAAACWSQGYKKVETRIEEARK